MKSLSHHGSTARGSTALPPKLRSGSIQALPDPSSRRTVLWRSLILSNSSSILSQQQQQQPRRANIQAAAMPNKLVDAHVHVWAPVQDARSGKYPFFVSGSSDTGLALYLDLSYSPEGGGVPVFSVCYYAAVLPSRTSRALYRSQHVIRAVDIVWSLWGLASVGTTIPHPAAFHSTANTSGPRAKAQTLAAASSCLLATDS